MRKLTLLILALLLCVLAYSQDTIVPAAIQSKSAKQKEAVVLICLSEKAYAYHSRRCSGLARCKAEVKSVTKTEAKEKTYTPCKICYK